MVIINKDSTSTGLTRKRTVFIDRRDKKYGLTALGAETCTYSLLTNLYDKCRAVGMHDHVSQVQVYIYTG